MILKLKNRVDNFNIKSNFIKIDAEGLNLRYLKVALII